MDGKGTKEWCIENRSIDVQRRGLVKLLRPLVETALWAIFPLEVDRIFFPCGRTCASFWVGLFNSIVFPYPYRLPEVPLRGVARSGEPCGSFTSDGLL